MHAQRYGYTQMINNAILTNSSYKLRFAQDLTLYLSEIGMDLQVFDATAGKTHWLEDPIWQGTREATESIMGADDYLEQYFAINVVFEPMVGELFRSGFVMQMAAAQNDSPLQPSFPQPKPITNRTSPIRSSCSTCWPTMPSMVRPTARSWKAGLRSMVRCA